jgi:hypothetical protein
MRDGAFLRALLEKPSRFYPGTPMPPYASLFHHRGAGGDALITYLRSLRGQPRKSAGPVAALACATCHATPRPASAPALSRHACVRLSAENEAFSCRRCHGDAVPSGPRECAYVEGRRAECAACHEVPR